MDVIEGKYKVHIYMYKKTSWMVYTWIFFIDVDKKMHLGIALYTLHDWKSSWNKIQFYPPFFKSILLSRWDLFYLKDI